MNAGAGSEHRHIALREVNVIEMPLVLACEEQNWTNGKATLALRQMLVPQWHLSSPCNASYLALF